MESAFPEMKIFKGTKPETIVVDMPCVLESKSVEVIS